MGDVVSACLVALASVLSLPISAFAALNLAFITCWLWVLVALGREHSRRKATDFALLPEGTQDEP
jgi:hypothetical protein